MYGVISSFLSGATKDLFTLADVPLTMICSDSIDLKKSLITSQNRDRRRHKAMVIRQNGTGKYAVRSVRTRVRCERTALFLGMVV